MSFYRVTITHKDGSTTTEEVADVNHWEGGLIELVYRNTATKLVKGYKEIDISPRLDDETGAPIETIID